MMRALVASLAALGSRSGDLALDRHLAQRRRRDVEEWRGFDRYSDSPFGCSTHPEKNRRNKAAKAKRRAQKARRKAAARARRITLEARRG